MNEHDTNHTGGIRMKNQIMMMLALCALGLAAQAAPVPQRVAEIEAATAKVAHAGETLPALVDELEGLKDAEGHEERVAELEAGIAQLEKDLLAVEDLRKHFQSLWGADLGAAFFDSGADYDVLVEAAVNGDAPLSVLNQHFHGGVPSGLLSDSQKALLLQHRVMGQDEPSLLFVLQMNVSQAVAEAVHFDPDIFVPYITNGTMWGWFLDVKKRAEGIVDREIEPWHFIRFALKRTDGMALGHLASLQKQILDSAQYYIVKHRRSVGLPVVTGTEEDAVNPLDECFEAIVAALNAPLWEGLEFALREQHVPTMDVDRHPFIDRFGNLPEDALVGRLDNYPGVGLNPVLGQLQLLLGVEGFNDWVEQYNAQ